MLNKNNNIQIYIDSHGMNTLTISNFKKTQLHIELHMQQLQGDSKELPNIRIFWIT